MRLDAHPAAYGVKEAFKTFILCTIYTFKLYILRREARRASGSLRTQPLSGAFVCFEFLMCISARPPDCHRPVWAAPPCSQRAGPGGADQAGSGLCLESLPMLLSDLVRVHRAGRRRIRRLRAGTRSCGPGPICGPGPPVYDYRGRGAPSHCLGHRTVVLHRAWFFRNIEHNET